MEPRLYYGSSVIMDELLNLSSENWQEVLLSQRDRATLCVSWSLGNCCTTVRKKIALENGAIRQATYHFLLVIRSLCSANVSILQRFRDIATFAVTVYVTSTVLQFQYDY